MCTCDDDEAGPCPMHGWDDVEVSLDDWPNCAIADCEHKVYVGELCYPHTIAAGRARAAASCAGP